MLRVATLLPRGVGWSRFGAVRRGLFIQHSSTPNPRSVRFQPGLPVLDPVTHGSSHDFSSLKAAQRSPLARALFGIESVTGVMLGPDFVVVSVTEGADWATVRPHVFAAISDFYASGEPVMGAAAAADGEGSANDTTRILDTDSEVVAMIKELLEKRIRPSVQGDGGDVLFRGFEEDTGVVYLQLQGSCVGCPSSSVTLKNGIENMLMHYIPEVEEVREWKDEGLEKASREALQKLEQKLEDIKQ